MDEVEEIDADDLIREKLYKISENTRQKRPLVITFTPNEMAILSAYAKEVNIPIETLGKLWILEQLAAVLAQASQSE